MRLEIASADGDVSLAATGAHCPKYVISRASCRWGNVKTHPGAYAKRISVQSRIRKFNNFNYNKEPPFERLPFSLLSIFGNLGRFDL